MWFAVIFTTLYFVSWIYLQWEVIKSVKGKNGGWIALCSLGSSICAFLCGVFLTKILFFNN